MDTISPSGSVNPVPPVMQSTSVVEGDGVNRTDSPVNPNRTRRTILILSIVIVALLILIAFLLLANSQASGNSNQSNNTTSQDVEDIDDQDVVVEEDDNEVVEEDDTSEVTEDDTDNNPYGASQEVRDILDEFGYVDAGFSNFEILVPEHHNWARYPDNTHGSFAGVFNVPGLIGFEISGYYPIFGEAGGLPEDLDEFIDFHQEYVLSNFSEEHQSLYTNIEKYDIENFGIAFISPVADNSDMIPGDTMNLSSSMLIFDYSGKINPRTISVYKTYTYDDSINTADFQHNILKYMAAKLTLDSN